MSFDVDTDDLNRAAFETREASSHSLRRTHGGHVHALVSTFALPHTAHDIHMTCRSRLCRSSPLEPWPAAPLAPLPFAGAMPFAPLPPLPFAAPAYVKIGPRLARSCVCVGVGSAPGNGSGVPSARLAVVRVCVLGGSGTSRWLIVVVCVVILIDEPFVCVIFRVPACVPFVPFLSGDPTCF
jgi:hypothetical protein